MNARERIDLIMDTGTFKEIDANLTSVNPLGFPGYEDKLAESKEKTELNEGVVTGYGKIHGNDAVIAVMDSRFIMGSMGSVVGKR
jgi:acetyl-CoA carboxylase carboxyl transferase subunit beta